jgi:transcription antitermination factor NusG
MTAAWYALRSKTGKEESLWRLAQSHGFETWYPHVFANAVNPRARKFRPYLPGYLFVNADLSQTGTDCFGRMQNAIGLLSFGDSPAVIETHVLRELRARVDAVRQVGGDAFVGLTPGAAVTIQTGPFAGYDAIFDMRLSGDDRVRVFVTFMNDRQVAVELRAGQLKPRRGY